MVLLIHILVALASLVYSAYVFFYPSKTKLQVSYGFVGLTILSGTILLISKPGHIIPACLMGLLYLGVSSLGIISARTKLARQTN